MCIKQFFLGVFLLISLNSNAKNIDSLWSLYQRYDTSKDTSILNVIYEITLETRFSQPDTTLFLLNKGLAIAKKRKVYKYISYYYETMGDTYWQLTEFKKSKKAYNNALAEYLKIGERGNAGFMHANVAYVFMEMGKYEDAFNSLQEALNIAEQENNEALEILTLSYLANLYSYMNQFNKAIETYKKTLNYYIKQENTRNVQMSLNNIGTIFFQANNLDSAELYFHQSLAVGKKIGDNKNIANGLLNLGSIAYKKKEFSEAETFYKEALTYNIDRGDDSQLFKNYINLSNVYFNLNKFNASYQYAMKAKGIADKTNNIKSKSSVHSTLASYYKSKKDYKHALENYEIHVQLEDSILGLEQTKQINELAAKYENERKELEILNLEKDKQLKEVLLSEKEIKLQQEGMYRIGLIIGIMFVFIIAIFIFIGYKSKSKSHEIISKQKHLVEEKNREITDSITYAKRIQNAILPSDTTVKEYLPNNFILYLPKDIIAGDFYWLEHKDDNILFAAADCTGHGVPGAMVSVVCNNALNRTVREYGLTNPAEILNKTREIVVQEFEKSDDDVKDGMDISLCCLELSGSYATLQWAGANNPLWIIR
ncbi:MAG TPA: tetratricopeptide repeat protein, partial [Vicingaceae bacterium]